MALQRDGYHHGDLRNALVASAVRLIEASGTSSFSLREAAREVGVSANAAYRHFDDKSALMTAVAAFGFRQLATQMVGAMARRYLRRATESAPAKYSTPSTADSTFTSASTASLTLANK
jgi:AcrR family transcriptional regulator